MRIGLFSDYYLARGDGTAIATHISQTGLQKAGYKVYIFCPQVRAHAQPAEVTAFGSLPGPFYQGLRLSWPFSSKNLDKVKNLKLDVIHVQTPLPVGLFGLWCSKKLDVPAIFTVHLDMDFMDQYYISAIAMFMLGGLSAIITGRYKSFWRLVFARKVRLEAGRRQDFAWRMMTFFAGQFDQVIAPSHKSYELLSNYLEPSGITLIPNGVDAPSIPKAAARKQLGTPREDFIVVSTARHVKEKRIEIILEAFAKLRRPAQLWVLNSGPQLGRLKKLAAELGINGQTKFFGTLPREQVFTYLAAADVFANACRREVASLGILEAAAAGKPLLLLDKRLSEPLQEGLNGYFIKSSTELTTKLEGLANQPKLVARFGANSHKRVTRTYSVAAHIAGLEAVYGRLTGRG